MGEMAELWADYKAHKQKKKRSNLAYSTGQLSAAGLPFTVHNGGIHLVLTKGAETIDFWPSTGLWWVRTNRNKRRGINKLIAYMKGKP